MKKIALFVLALLSFAVTSAQFQVKAKVRPSKVIWKSIVGSRCELRSNVSENGEIYYYITMITTNQFDDPFLLWLGNKKQAQANLSQLINDLYKRGEIYTLQDAAGKKFTLYCYGAKTYSLNKSGYAGSCYLPIAQLEKMLVAMEE